MRALVLLALLCLDREGMRRQIVRQLGPVRACYARALASEGPGFAGKLSIQFVIGPEGRVTEASVHTTELKSERFEACVVSAVKRWRFLKPPDGSSVTIAYPITFRPAG